ncbi:MAG TPA: hypothetical protein PKC38_13075, partial [Chitinophagales bacterium]|nr:hypothetical protein [Chitinophagales bacterium]
KENPIVTIEGHEQLQLSANSGIIDASATEYSDIWRIFCTDDIEPDISCECNDFVNPPANDLANIFKSLISTGNLVTDPTQVLLYDHTYAGADYYYHGCTPEFLEAFGFSMDGVYNVVWSSEIVGDNLQCNLIWLRNPGEPQICSFELGTADDVMNLGNAYGSDLLGDMNFEMIVPNTAVVGSCGPIDEFTLNATYYNPSTPGYVNITLSCESFTCFPLRNCNLKYTPPVFCMGSEGDHANPYLLGIRGNWQPKIAFKYLTDRTPEAYFTDASPSGNEAAIRDQGLYTSFIPFWSPNALAVWEKNTDPKWTWTAQTMLIDPLAHTASVKDALDIYSSSTYNLNHVAAELVANNAKYNQIAFENYEDDFYLDVANPSDCHSKHFDINPDA